MKRIKIMLLSLLLLAVVGGTMAFKSKFSIKYCTTATVSGSCAASPGSCGLTTNMTTTNLEVTPVCTTATNAQGNCTGVTNCVNWAKLTTN